MKINRHSLARRGLAVVEAAITLPIIILVIFTTVGICNQIYLQQKLEVVAFEAVRVSVIPGSEMADVVAQAEELAEARGISDIELTVEPTNFASAEEGTFITVSVSADPKTTSKFFLAKKVTASVSMMKEND